MDAQSNKLEPACTDSGDPLPKQQRLVKQAMNRSPAMRKVRCLIGIHNPPHDKIVNEMGVIMIGGPCVECDNDTYRELVWIGNEWDFPGVASVIKTRYGTEIKTTDPHELLIQITKHLEYLHS